MYCNILTLRVLVVQLLEWWTLTHAIGVRTLAKAIIYMLCLNNIQVISDESSAELVLYLCEELKCIAPSTFKKTTFYMLAVYTV